MHRVIASTRLLRPPTQRTFASAACRCQSAARGSEQPAPTSSAGSEPSAAYSLPHDAFAAGDPSPSTAPSARPPTRTATLKPRQRQFLSNAEAQAFADLLGEILPRSLPSTDKRGSAYPSDDATGLFDLFSPGAAAAQSPDVASSVGRIQQALLRKVGSQMGVSVEPGSGKWERKARGELAEHEALELDRLREELVSLKSDKDVLDWGMRNVFGYKDAARVGILPDPATLPIEVPPSVDSGSARTVATVGPSSRIFPDLLHLLFVVLRDTHQSPHAALSVFSLAASNPFSYIAGCTTALYNEVLRTRWAEGDVESLLSTLEEMRAAGLALDDRTRELVAAVGEAMRVDADRAEARVAHLLDARLLAQGILDEAEREREVSRRRFFSSRQVEAWGRMERIVEENLGELERARRDREDERWQAQEQARAAREGFERDQVERERPSLLSRRRLSPYDEDRPPRRGGGGDGGGYGDDRAPVTAFGWREPRPELGADGRMGPPKRPSFANPYKIRRKSLTKEEKSSKDTKHPALWWKH